MAVIDSAYQYYLSTYGSSSATRYDTHKKSQLRAVYNNIVKTNKEAPLYKLKNTGEAKIFAIDLKERARSIQNVAASLSDAGGAKDAFTKKIAQSSDTEAVSAEYIGQDQDTDDSVRFEVQVKQLASPQINRGKFLAGDKCDIAPGTYSFDLMTAYSSYEFQYNVTANDTNRNVQEKLMRLINNANVGLRAEIISDKEGKTALQVRSRQTGLSEDERYLFEILPAPDNGSMKAMRTLGVDQVTETAKNSSFILNGTERSSLSNTFTVNNAFELTLRQPSREDAPVTIGFKADSEAVADNIESLVTVYNNMIQLGHNYEDTQQSKKLLFEMQSVTRSYYNELEAVGLQADERGYIKVDRNLLTDAVSSPDAKDCFLLLNSFKNDINDKASRVSIDPMNYVNKIVVTYKNPGHNFATPYITSIYSGMMLDKSC